MGNKFFKKSSADIATGIAQAEFGDVLKGTVSGAMNAGTYADMGKSAMGFGKSVKDIGLGLDFINKIEPIQYTKKQPKDYEDS